MHDLVYKKYVPVKRDPNKAIDDKMKVLREFCVVDRRNEQQIEQMLIDAINANPERDYEIVLDQVARALIKKRLGDG